MKKISVLLLLWIGSTAVAADFSPAKYAVYQMSRLVRRPGEPTPDWNTVRGVEVSVLRQQGFAQNDTNIRCFMDGVKSTNVRDTAFWAVGPQWLIPNPGDSIAYAARIKRVAESQKIPLFKNSNPLPGKFTIATTLRFNQSTAADTAGFSAWFNTNNLGTIFMMLCLMPSGTILVKDPTDFSPSRMDTLPVKNNPGKWQPVLLEFRYDAANHDTLLFFWGDSCVYSKSWVHLPGTTTLKGLEFYLYGSQQAKTDVCDFAYFEGVGGKDAWNGYMLWQPVSCPTCIDTFDFPAYIHQIIYDPPGDGSYSSITHGSSTQHTTSFHIGDEIGVSGFLGYMYNNDEAGSTFDAQVSLAANFAYNYNSEYTSAYQATTSIQSSIDAANVQFIGPGRGDMVVYEPLKIQQQLWRRPRSGAVGVVPDSSYVYTVTNRILPDPKAKIHLSTMGALMDLYKQDTSTLALLKGLYALDPATGKVRQDLIASGRLEKVKSLVFAGNSPFSMSVTTGTSFTYTHSWDASVEFVASIAARVTGVKFGASFRNVFTVGGAKTQGSGQDTTIGCYLFDKDSWDRYSVNVYRDRVLNTFVFDVDSTESYSSWPFETTYSQKSADWKITPVDSFKTGKTGEQVAFKFAVANNTPKIVGAPTNLTFSGAMVNYPNQSVVQPAELSIDRGKSDTMIVKLSSPDTGLFGGFLRISVANPGGGDPATEDIPLRVSFTKTGQGLYAQCKAASYTNPKPLDPMTNTFTVTIKNVGEGPVEIETGVSSASQGLTYQVGSFSNPVAGGDTRSISVALTGTGNRYPFTAKFWTQIKGAQNSYSEIVLSMDTGKAADVMQPGTMPVTPRTLSVTPIRGGCIGVFVPVGVPAAIRIFDLRGKQLYRLENVLGSRAISRNDFMRNCIVIVRVLQGNTMVQKKVLLLR